MLQLMKKFLLFALPEAGKTTISNKIKKVVLNVNIFKSSDWMRKDELYLNNSSMKEIYNIRIVNNRNYWNDLIINDLSKLQDTIFIIESTHSIYEFIQIKNIVKNTLLIGIFQPLKCLIKRVKQKETTEEDKFKKIKYIYEHYENYDGIKHNQQFDYIFNEHKTSEIFNHLL